MSDEILNYGVIKLSEKNEDDKREYLEVCRDDPKIKQDWEFLEFFNYINSQHDWRWRWPLIEARDVGYEIDGSTEEVSLFKSQLIYNRVFNRGSYEFNKGGRFFCSFMSRINSYERGELTVNGNRVAELDFKNNHIRIAYSLRGIGAPGTDLYDVGEESRTLVGRAVVKALMLTMINKESGKQGLNNSVNGHWDKGKFKPGAWQK
jgi:hypothetical protein